MTLHLGKTGLICFSSPEEKKSEDVCVMGDQTETMLDPDKDRKLDMHSFKVGSGGN